jgi:hypothetical protein
MNLLTYIDDDDFDDTARCVNRRRNINIVACDLVTAESASMSACVRLSRKFFREEDEDEVGGVDK